MIPQLFARIQLYFRVIFHGMNRIEYVYLSIKDAHDRQYNYMKITIFTLIGMIRLIGFNIQDIQIHVNIQFL